jgi:tripartite-type tricarboxylate transporter receptor subunit TctC
MKNKLFKTTMTLALQIVGGLTLTLGANASALAQANWPDRPIKLIVAYPPGGPVDTTGRVFARFLGDTLKQTVVVENKAGASGMIGADATAKATPDGYTLNFVASPSLTISPIVQRSKLFNPRTDFTVISPIVNYANVLLIGPQIPAKSVGELVDYARKNPEKVSFGSAGFGGSNHLSAELLKQSTKTQMLHVPYKGNAPAMVDVLGGKVTFMFDITSTGKAFIDSGKARGLAVTSKQRNPSMPNIPTMIEAGIADYEVLGWFAVIGPKNIPQPIVTKLTAAVEAVKKNPEFIKAVEAGGYSLDKSDAKALSARIDSEYKMWEGVITKGNIYPNQ